MKYNTRYNPTTSGASHVGHLYMALVNANEAHRSGGKFIVRVDDNQEYWVHEFGIKLIDQYCAEYCEQLNRFMHIDKWERQSLMPTVRDIIGNNPLLDVLPKVMWLHDQVPEWIVDPDMAMYPYAPQYTIEKVVWDFYDRVNWLIRGEDLATECSLYDFFVDIIGLPRMRHTLLPRLRGIDRKELLVSGLSKTLGTYKLDKQIEKFGVNGVLDYLKQSCLVDYDKDFYVENIKWNPTIVGFEP